MIIAISGKANSGKDLVGRIIQYLTDNKNGNLPFESWYSSNTYTAYTQSYGDWQIKKFADKLKEIIALLIGCTKEDLENEEFKSIELGEEWWFYKLQNVKFNTYKHIKYTPAYDKNVSLDGFTFVKLIKPTPRFLLQNIGTDLFRNQLHPDIWVNSLMREYKPLWKEAKHQEYNGFDAYSVKCKVCGVSFVSKNKHANLCNSCIDAQENKYPNWIITDMRFPNELKAVKDRNGISIRVNRLKFPINSYSNGKASDYLRSQGIQPGLQKGNLLIFANKIWERNNKEHYSETVLDNAEFDHIIDNNGTVEELVEKVREILIKENVIKV